MQMQRLESWLLCESLLRPLAELTKEKGEEEGQRRKTD